MAQRLRENDVPEAGVDASPPEPEFYCPRCARPVLDPLVCGDCMAVICRTCGTTLEQVDDLGIG